MDCDFAGKSIKQVAHEPLQQQMEINKTDSANRAKIKTLYNKVHRICAKVELEELEEHFSKQLLQELQEMMDVVAKKQIEEQELSILARKHSFTRSLERSSGRDSLVEPMITSLPNNNSDISEADKLAKRFDEAIEDPDFQPVPSENEGMLFDMFQKLTRAAYNVLLMLKRKPELATGCVRKLPGIIQMADEYDPDWDDKEFYPALSKLSLEGPA